MYAESENLKSGAEQERFVLTLPILAEKWQKDKLERVFRAGNNLKNALTARKQKAYAEMTRTRRWQNIEADILSLRTDLRTAEREKDALDEKKRRLKSERKRLSKRDAERLKQLKADISDIKHKKGERYAERNAVLREYGFSEYDFHRELTSMRRHFRALIPANVAQKLGTSVWKAFSDLLSGKADKVHFSPIDEFVSIETKTCGDIMFDPDSMSVRFAGMTMRVNRSADDPHGYEENALSRERCYCRILRKPYPEGWRYFLQIVLKGAPPVKGSQQLGNGSVGNDIGPQTLAAVSSTGVVFEKLAEGAQTLEDRITAVNRAMERSRKAMNPGMYGTDGQIIRIDRLPSDLVSRGRDGKLHRRWRFSKRYRRLAQQRRSLFRQQRELRDTRHRQLINRLIRLGSDFYIEKMNWRALAKRAKTTKKRTNGRYASKKRFGRSITNRAPGRFVTLYRNRVERLGGTFHEINTRAARASQYDHTNDTYTKKKLSERYAHLSDGTAVQRDLYSAFLIGHVQEDLASYDKTGLNSDFAQFSHMHDIEMQRLARSNRQLPSSMGLTR